MGLDNIIRPEQSVTKGSTGLLTVNFVDDIGNPTAPASANYSLYNFLDGSIINGRGSIDCTPIASATTSLIELTPADNPIVDPTLHIEDHRLIVKYWYGQSFSRIGKVEIQIVVENSVGA